MGKELLSLKRVKWLLPPCHMRDLWYTPCQKKLGDSPLKNEDSLVYTPDVI